MNDVCASVGMAQVNCASCGMVFWAPAAWVKARREDHLTFKCPNNHDLWFGGKTEAEKLRDELDREKRCCESNRARAASLTELVEHREAQIRGYKGALAKEKKRQPRRMLASAAGPDAG